MTVWRSGGALPVNRCTKTGFEARREVLRQGAGFWGKSKILADLLFVGVQQDELDIYLVFDRVQAG